MPDYQAAVIGHIKEYSAQLDGYLIDTVYFGGGTPSIFGAGRLISIFNALKKNWHVLLDAEVTAEVNPGDVTKEDLLKLRRAGFNRLSMGVQSSDDKALENLGRSHTFADAEETVKNARQAGFENIGVDIMYGLPSQDKESWAQTVARAASLKTEHMSCYELKIEEGTQLYAYKDSPFLPDEDTVSDMYLYAVETLSRFGYAQYEISNFARRGYESKHNLKTWLGEDYIGFGPGAHSYIDRCRYSFIEDVESYIERLATGQAVVEHSEEMSDFENAGEYLTFRLRTTYGISEEEYYDIYRLKMDNIIEVLKKFEANGWAINWDGRWRFTPRGFLISNRLIGELLEAQTKQRNEISRPWQAGSDEESQMTLFESKPISAGVYGSNRSDRASAQ